MKKTTKGTVAIAVLLAFAATSSPAWAWGLTFKTDFSKRDNRRYDQSNRQRVGGNAIRNSGNRLYRTDVRHDNRLYDSSDNSVRMDSSRHNSHNVGGSMNSNNRYSSHNVSGTMTNSVLGNVDNRTSAGQSSTGGIYGSNNYVGNTVSNGFNLGDTNVEQK